MAQADKMRVGSLFAGIGGFDLGLERAGMECSWQVEIDPWARKVLAKHWPDAARYEDVREVGAHNLAPVDVICGGFPCQDISNAGKKAGIEGERSGLWSEYARIIRELQPRYVIVENVAALLTRGIDTVLGDLAESGYNAEWDIISAAAVGAPHRRERLWIVAYPDSNGLEAGDYDKLLRESRLRVAALGGSEDVHLWDGPTPDRTSFCGTSDGVPRRVDRLRGLGNAVVPQVVEWIGRRIMEAD
tara:strand:- start:179 stop:913 length:735 start_codon:yes stop_codon:yes gene_type:complete